MNFDYQVGVLLLIFVISFSRGKLKVIGLLKHLVALWRDVNDKSLFIVFTTTYK